MIMRDSTRAFDIPADTPMVAGYIDGLYRWSDKDWARFPSAVKVRIAVFANTLDGDVLDVEQGNATPVEAPRWVVRRRAQGIIPVVYCNRSNIAEIKSEFAIQKVAEPLYWLATLDGSLPWAPGIVAIQYHNSVLAGGHYDESVVDPSWPGLTAPAPVVLPGSNLLPRVNPTVTTDPVIPSMPAGPPLDPCVIIKAERDALQAKLDQIRAIIGG